MKRRGRGKNALAARAPAKPDATAAATKKRDVRPGSAKESFPVVGVGASAGGLEAFTQLLKHLPRDSVLNDFEVEHEFPRVGRRRMLLNACRILNRDNQPQAILLVIEEVTEHRLHEKV